MNMESSYAQPSGKMRCSALETCSPRRRYVDRGPLDALIDTYPNQGRPRHTVPQVVSAVLLCDGRLSPWPSRGRPRAIGSMGFTGRQGENMVAVENTQRSTTWCVHPVSSCSPGHLGRRPHGKKKSAYRARVARIPSGVAP